MNFTNCNLCYPKLFAFPSYGDAMRYHAEPSETSHEGETLGINCYGDEFKDYLSVGKLRVDVDWGTNHAELCRQLCPSGHGNDDDDTRFTISAQLTVHGIGKRPAMIPLASNSTVTDLISLFQHDNNSTIIFPPFGISWRHDVNDKTLHIYPEYLVHLQLSHSYEGSISNNNITRYLHVVPPPIGRLGFRLSDVIWAPNLFRGDQDHANDVMDYVLARREARASKDNDDTVEIRRRGFGLELETVQLPPDFANDCFTHQQQFVQTVERARGWHLTRATTDENCEDVSKRVNEMYDELLSWQVSHDLYVDNNAPPTRLDLYQQIMAHIEDKQCDQTFTNDEEAICTLNELVLGGRVEVPAAFLADIPNQNIPISLSSPEYKSPPPPNELYHTFPPPEDGNDSASDSIRLFLDGVLKNAEASRRAIAVPTVSDIGQSGTSIHVHVNINNPNAWPREAVSHRKDAKATSSLLSVIYGWIVFDRVIQSYFNMPNVWRDRSFAPMYATGPEYSWNEPSWKHGNTTLKPEQVTHVKLNNIQAWFEHVHSSMNLRVDKKNECSLFEAVFDHESITNTISRWNSLNLLSLKLYGTIEFRRMHATLDPDIVSAWTWFCVGFVEKFSQDSMFDTFLYPFFGDGISKDHGLERLIDAQNHATIEDLFSIMCDKNDPAMPTKAFETLFCNGYIRD